MMHYLAILILAVTFSLHSVYCLTAEEAQSKLKVATLAYLKSLQAPTSDLRFRTLSDVLQIPAQHKIVWKTDAVWDAGIQQTTTNLRLRKRRKKCGSHVERTIQCTANIYCHRLQINPSFLSNGHIKSTVRQWKCMCQIPHQPSSVWDVWPSWSEQCRLSICPSSIRRYTAQCALSTLGKKRRKGVHEQILSMVLQWHNGFSQMCLPVSQLERCIGDFLRSFSIDVNMISLLS